MENTQNTQNTVIAQAAATTEAKVETKAKRNYHRLTEEEKAERAKQLEAYKAGVAERKAKRAEKKAAAQEAFEARRNVEFDVSEIRAAADALTSMDVAKVDDVRAKINSLMAAVVKADKLMHHRAKATTITVK